MLEIRIATLLDDFVSKNTTWTDANRGGQERIMQFAPTQRLVMTCECLSLLYFLDTGADFPLRPFKPLLPRA